MLTRLCPLLCPLLGIVAATRFMGDGAAIASDLALVSALLAWIAARRLTPPAACPTRASRLHALDELMRAPPTHMGAVAGTACGALLVLSFLAR